MHDCVCVFKFYESFLFTVDSSKKSGQRLVGDVDFESASKVVYTYLCVFTKFGQILQISCGF